MEKKLSRMDELREKYKNYDFLGEEIKAYNERYGDLKYINCDICRNKGYIAINEHNEMKLKKCVCMKQRNVVKQLENCGIPFEKQKEYTFDNIWEQEEWQRRIKQKAIEYCNEEYKNKWFVIYGLTGIGKTTVCTTIFLDIIKKGYSGKYLLWNDEISNLIKKKDNFSEYLQEEYDNAMKEFKNVDVLYIDDLLKLTSEKKLIDHLSILYEIINYRYLNNKTTIITTEYTKEQIEKIDLAIAGRIHEKSVNFELKPIADKSRNQRYKGVVKNEN